MEPIVETVVYVIPGATDGLSEWAPLLSAVAAAMSVLVACIAVWFSHRQMKMHERQSHLMATPHLSGWNYTEGETGDYSFTLENTGIGPAIIKEIRLLIDGKLVEGEGSEMIEKAAELLFPGIRKRHEFEMFTVGEFIPPNRKFHVYRINAPHVSAETLLAHVQSRAALVIKYQCIYGNKYVYDSEND